MKVFCFLEGQYEFGEALNKHDDVTNMHGKFWIQNLIKYYFTLIFSATNVQFHYVFFLNSSLP